jgi:hypothetical protein
MYLLSALGFARAVVARVGILGVPAARPRPIIEIPDLDSIMSAFFLHAFGA